MRVNAISFNIHQKTTTIDEDIQKLEQELSINKQKQLSFKGYSSPLKKAFLKGALGDDFIGIYGHRLDKTNYSIEHIIPISKGGTNDLGNQFLADRKANNERGVEDIGKFLTLEMVRKYLKRFVDVKTPYFDGNAYIKAIRKTLTKIVDD